MIRYALWVIGRFFRGLNYEPQHVDPWDGDFSDRIPGSTWERETYNEAAEVVMLLPRTLPAPDFEAVLAAPRVVGQAPLILGEQWLHVHWWWYGQAAAAEAQDYHDEIAHERRAWRREMGLPLLELAEAAA